MSAQTTATTRVMPLRSPLPKQAKRAAPLRLVPPRRSSAARAPFVVVLVTMLVGGLLGLLMLNTLVAQQSFTLHDLTGKSKVLDQQEQDLAKQVEALSGPAALAQRATQLGMVPGGPPAFLRLSDGKVLGDAQPGVAPAPPVTAPPATSTTSTKATSAKPAKGSTTWTTPKSPAAKPPTTPGTSKAPATSKAPGTTKTGTTKTGAHR